MHVQPLHILLVDDDQDDYYFFVTALKENEIPAHISHAKNGVEALHHLKQKSLPNIIFLDINMPVMDGLTALEQIRANKGYKDVQIIIFSTSDDPVLIRNAYERGAQLYLRKPDHFTDYKLLLGSLLTGTSTPEAFIRR